MKQSTSDILADLFIRYPKLRSAKKDIYEVCDCIISCYKSGSKMLLCGNGGSAADSEHIVGELMKGFMSPRKLTHEQESLFISALESQTAKYMIKNLQQGLPAISLVSQSGLYTAYVNDVAPDMVMAQQVFVYGNPGDILFAITTSGSSVNVIRALDTARACGISSIVLMGQKNRQNAKKADFIIAVDEIETYKVQELHLPIYHALCAAVESEMFA